jgi:copper homeostasis protein
VAELGILISKMNDDERHVAPLLEVIACSMVDAIEAERGGANRLEVVRDLSRGGLTPSWRLVAEIKRVVNLPLRVMLRESTQYEVSDADEIARLCDAAQRFASLDVDGFVLGFLKNGEVDIELTQKVLACAPQVRSTFHHAFEDARNKLRALEELHRLPQIDRVLSSGGNDGLDLRVQRLRDYEKRGSPRLTIIAGGGIDAEAIRKIRRETGIREFHVGRAARAQLQVEGAVQSSLVGGLVQRLVEIQ